MNGWEIFALTTSVILFSTFVFWLIIDYKNKKIIYEKSQKVATLLSLNRTIHFATFQPRYLNYQTCNSKRQLDHLSMDEYLITLIDSNIDFYRNIVENIESNINKYTTYIKQTQTISSTASEEFCNTFKFTLKKFRKYEERVFQKNILKIPQVNVSIYCKATYTSPQGRNHYYKEQNYNYNDLKRLFDYTVSLKESRQTRQYQIKVERAKMTDSLRYDILKRDNFRCQICGSSAQDGVKLHVDHIIPIAKGGKTVPNNLRTLCDRCNMGKSDKI